MRNYEGMSLREFMLIGYNGKMEHLFSSDAAALLAERWDAEIFVRQFFNKGLNEVRKKDVRLVFIHYARKAALDLEDYSELDSSFVDGNTRVIDGGYKKLNLKFNDNFEIDYSDEF